MKSTTVIFFVTLFVAIVTCIKADDAVQNSNTDKRVNTDSPPYLFVQGNIGEDLLIIYEQLARKTTEDRSIISVMRTIGGKSDATFFTAKVETFKDGLCRIRILEDANNSPPIAKAKELLGIKSNLFEVHYRDVQGQMSKILLSVKDSQPSEQAAPRNR